MNKKFLILILITFGIFSFSLMNARVVFIGPSRQFQTPSQAQSAIQDGDTIEIDAGFYKGDVCPWYNSNLLIRGVGGMAHFDADSNSCEGKAIWVLKGNNTIVENIEFSDCHVPDLNGAGIRQEGTNLIVRHCFFHDNEDGVLTGADSNSTILFEYSEFGHNGASNGFSHNIYIGSIKSFTMQFCYSHHAKVGHLVKTRAANNFIQYNRLMDETDGNSSYDVDISNGGYSIIMGNTIMKGANAENGSFISYGMETIKPNYSNVLQIINNTFVNERSMSHIVQFPAPAKPLMYNNLMVNVQYISADSVNEFYDLMLPSIDSAYFVDPANFDYHLTSKSPAIDKGIWNWNDTMTLKLPNYEYKDTCQSVEKIISGNGIDIGAFEYVKPNDVSIINNDFQFYIFPNPINNNSKIFLKLLGNDYVEITAYDLLGRKIKDIFIGELSSGEHLIPIPYEIIEIESGFYQNIFFVLKLSNSQITVML